MAKGGTTALAALILSIVLFVFFTALGIYFYRQVEALPEGSGAGGLKYRLDEKKKELRTEKATLAEKEAKLAEVVIQLRLALEKYNMLETDVNRERKDGHIFGERTKTSTSQTRTAEVIKRKVTEEKEAQRTGISSEKDNLDADHARQLSDLRKRVDELTKDNDKEENRKKRLEEEFRRKRGILDSDIANLEDVLERITAREIELAGTESDGKVLKVEEVTKLAVISVGASQGVRKGMRFEVFQVKEGTRRVHKGLLEVKTVDAETSTATILYREIRLPRCPSTGYAASRPEERFSPYDSTGQSGLRVVKLLAPPKRVIWGMNPEDPMTEGDRIFNPFFHPSRKLRFCVKGEKIEYDPEEIVRTIKDHGGVIDDEVTATTDYLVSQRWAQEHVKKAQELGVPVLHEYDVFDFLRHYQLKKEK